MCSEPCELEMRTWTFERTHFSLAKGERKREKREREREREQLKIYARTAGYPFQHVSCYGYSRRHSER